MSVSFPVSQLEPTEGSTLLPERGARTTISARSRLTCVAKLIAAFAVFAMIESKLYFPDSPSLIEPCPSARGPAGLPSIGIGRSRSTYTSSTTPWLSL